MGWGRQGGVARETRDNKGEGGGRDEGGIIKRRG